MDFLSRRLLLTGINLISEMIPLITGLKTHQLDSISFSLQCLMSFSALWIHEIVHYHPHEGKIEFPINFTQKILHLLLWDTRKQQNIAYLPHLHSRATQCSGSAHFHCIVTHTNNLVVTDNIISLKICNCSCSKWLCFKLLPWCPPLCWVMFVLCFTGQNTNIWKY